VDPGFGVLADAVTVFLNSAMVAERTEYPGDLQCSDRDEAEHLLEKFLLRDEKIAPALTRWAEYILPESFTVFRLPASHRRRLRTTNLAERLNEEIRRRSRVARLFPNEAACLRLVSAAPMEISKD